VVVGLFGRVQRLWTGKVLRDYGVIGDRSIRGVRRTIAVLLTERGGTRLVIRETYTGLGFRVNFIELDRDEVVKLNEVIQEALPQL
jgi:hypothetical protein